VCVCVCAACVCGLGGVRFVPFLVHVPVEKGEASGVVHKNLLQGDKHRH